MKIRQFSFAFIATSFAIGIALLLVVQYFTNGNVETLIRSNEVLLKHYAMTGHLTELQKDLLVVENKIKLAVITGDSVRIGNIDDHISKIRAHEIFLTQNGDAEYKPDIAKLRKMLEQRMEFDRVLIDNFYTAGRPAAVRLISQKEPLESGDDIKNLIDKLNTSMNSALANKIEAVDMNGKKVLRYNQYILFLVLFLVVGGFLLISNRNKKQTELIEKLNESERKLREAALIKEHFLANMSHEIRTPLNAILGYTNLMQQKSLDPESRFYIQTVQQSGDTLLTIVNDILDLSKIESGMMRIENAPFSLKDLVQSVTAMFTHKIQEKGLTITTQLPENTPDLLNGDATRLSQILANLIGNAVKFTVNGGIIVTIKTRKIDIDKVDIEFTIHDTGIGIEESKIESIFERFRQAEDSTTRKFGGTGLGLSIAKDLVHLQDGTIELKSTPGIGTTVVVRIPYSIISDPKTHPISSANDPISFPEKIAKVLIVEDNIVNQTLMAQYMKGLGISYVAVGDGKDAIEILKHESFDLVFMDIQMPEIDGYAASEAIRQKLNLDLPIIAMTAHAMAGEKEKCLSFGMNDHIAKPISQMDVKTILAKYLAVSNPIIPIQPIEYKGYKTINLQYIKEISAGNLEYEKVATGQFIELIPQQIEALQTAITLHDIDKVKRIAHDMISTVSIMGLSDILNNDLNTLKSESISGEETLLETFERIKLICSEALKEARSYYLHFQ